VTDSFTSIHDAPLHWAGGTGRGGHGGGQESGLPPENVLQEIDAQELNRMFVRRRDRPPLVWLLRPKALMLLVIPPHAGTPCMPLCTKKICVVQAA
jgi:hypothetical protein